MTDKMNSRLWVFRMAWRDSRSSRKRLLLFMSSIVLGIAALVAITSLGDSLESGVNDQAKELLGADLIISGSRPFDEKAEQLFDEIGGEQSRLAISQVATTSNS
jgi:putative ABC transport system permease protein